MVARATNTRLLIINDLFKTVSYKCLQETLLISAPTIQVEVKEAAVVLFPPRIAAKPNRNMESKQARYSTSLTSRDRI